MISLMPFIEMGISVVENEFVPIDKDRKIESNKKFIKSRVKSNQKEDERNKPQEKLKLNVERSNKIQSQSNVDQYIMNELLNTSKIPIQTQLDFARYGHAVLRSFLSPTLVTHYIKPLLYEHHHNSKNTLFAWQQKVQVASSLPITTIQKKFPTIKSCQSELKNILQTPIIEIPFLQHFNIWRTSVNDRNTEIQHNSNLGNPNNILQQLVTSPLLAHAAATLLNVPSVRLYQDSLFVKHLSDDGPTPWHSDAKMAPFDTSHFITFWIPLQYIPSREEGGTGLQFVDRSHIDFALPFWNEVGSLEYDRLEERYSYDNIYTGRQNRWRKKESTCIKDHMPLSIGDVTVHAGWTLHCANAGGRGDNRDNNTNIAKRTSEHHERYALALSYVDAKAEVREEYFQNSKGNKSNEQVRRLGDAEDFLSFRDWIHEVKPRQFIEHPFVPIVWPSEF